MIEQQPNKEKGVSFMKYRFIALALAGTLTFSMLAGCGGGNDNNSPAPESSAPVVENTDTPAPESSAPITEETPAPESSAPMPEESAKPSTPPASKPSAPAEPKPSAPTTPEKPQAAGVESIWTDISKLDLPSLNPMDDATLTALYGINTADLEEYVFMMPLMNVQATEFFIAKVKDGKMDAVKDGIAKRQADLDAQWAQYLPEQHELVKNYKLVTNGNYVIFAISSLADDAVSIFNSYTK